MSDNIYYFAYGSNMKRSRLENRVSVVKDLGKGKIKGKKFVFNKPSVDGSSKANLIKKDGYKSWGVIYEVTEDGLEDLDRIEGGYDKKEVQIFLGKRKVVARTFISPKKSVKQNQLRTTKNW